MVVGTALGAAVPWRGQQGLATAPVQGQPRGAPLPARRAWGKRPAQRLGAVPCSIRSVEAAEKDDLTAAKFRQMPVE